VKILFCPQDKKKKNMGSWTRVLQVFSIFIYSKITLLASEKTKQKKASLLEVFCVIKRIMRDVLVFFTFYFLIEKLLVCSTRPNEWAASMPFKWGMCRRPVAKSGHSPSP